MTAPAHPAGRVALRAAVIGGIGLVLGGALLVGPGAPVLVETMLDGRRLGPPGTLALTGVSGPHLGALRARSVAIRDAAGAWIELTDVRLRWQPWALLAGRVRIDTITAAGGTLHRRPELLPSNNQPPPSLDLRIDRVEVEQIGIDPAVGGPAATLALEGQLELRDGDLTAAQVKAVRLDAPTDQLTLLATTTTGLQVAADLSSQPGGLLAGLLDLDVPLTGMARITGTAAAGGGTVALRAGSQPLLAGEVGWTTTDWTVAATLNPSAVPIAAAVAARLGPEVRVSATGTRADGWAGPAQFSASAAAGQLNGEGTVDQSLQPTGRWQLTARQVDLAQVWPGQAGEVAVTGWAERTAQGLRFSGQASGQRLTALGPAARVAGPIDLRVDQDHITVQADFTGAAIAAPIGSGSMSLMARVHRAQWRVVAVRASAESPLGAVEAQGSALSDLSGNWRVASLASLIEGVRGTASGRFTWDGVGLAVEGNTAALAGLPDVAARLLGTQPSVALIAEPQAPGLVIRAATLSGPRLRLGARGRVSADATDLTLEGSARGPFAVGATPVLGVIDATGTLSGARGSEVLDLRATGTDLRVDGRLISPANGTLRYALRTGEGTFEGRGLLDGMPVEAAGRLAQGPGGIVVEGLEGRLAGLQARGRIGADRVDLTLAGRLEGLADLRGQVNGQLSLVSAPSGQRITAALRMEQGHIGGIAVSAGEVSIDGPALAAPLRYRLRGRAMSAPVELTGTGTLTLAPSGWRASLNGAGVVAGTPVATDGAAGVTSAGGRFTVTAPLRVGDGSLDLRLDLGRDRPEIDLLARSVPVAPVGALVGERAGGQISGHVRLAAVGSHLAGHVDLAVDQVRWARRIVEPVTAKVALSLADERLSGQVRVTTTNGFVGEARGAIAVRTEAASWRIGPQPEQTGELAWDLAGPAEALWGLVGSLDQSVTGTVAGSGQVRFSAGEIGGQGRLRLERGQIEDRQSGLILTDVVGEVVVGPSGPELITLTARDRAGGRLQAQGDGPGRIALQLDRLTLINRREVRAQADGALTLSWTDGTPLISGTLTLREALASNVLDPTPEVPQIDIVELNRPEVLAPATPVGPRTGLVPRLDLTVRAPRRLITRSRGAEAEWSLDTKVSGTLAEPLIRGEARLLRGDFQIGGRPFDVERGVVRFAGPPEEALLDITGRRVDPELTVRVAVSGTVANPELSLTSDPALPEDEILPQLLFGRSVDDLSAVQAAQLAASLGVLAGAGALDVAEIARRAVGLDRFDVREDGEGFLVAGGRYLTRTVYLEVARSSVGDASTRIEWRLRPQLTIVTSFLASGDQRASLRWRRESN